MRPCYIVDIDGTVADASHRVHHIKTSPKDWDAFFGAAMHDKPIKALQTLLQDLKFNYAVKFIYVSGRPAKYMRDTLNWLDLHEFPMGSRIYMRPDGDRRDDDIVKAELLQQVRADGWEPILAFDDRDRVVKMWRSNGVPCLQVAEGDF